MHITLSIQPIDPEDNGGRLVIVVPASNWLEFTVGHRNIHEHKGAV